MKELKGIATAIAGSGIIALAEITFAQTVLAQRIVPPPLPPIETSQALTSIATRDGQEFYITSDGTSRLFRLTRNDFDNPDQVPLFPSVNLEAPLSDVAVDSLGNVYIADSNSVDVFKSDGTFSGNISGGFLNPNGVVVGGSGNIYVADTGNNKVDIFKSNFELDSSLKGEEFFSSPTDVAIDSAGNIYVVDSGSKQIDIFDSSFNPLNGLEGFENPTDVTVDSYGNIYVIDFDDNPTDDKFSKVDVFNSSRQFISSIDGFTQPIGLTVDLSGKVYVLDAGQFFNPGDQTGIPPNIQLVDTTPIPEPHSALGILAFGVMGAGYMLKRKLKRSNRHLSKSA